jgi:hypothetical protein
MMREHPFSIWTLQGIPGGDKGVPAPADLESWGSTWRNASYEYLIGVCARAYAGNAETASMPAFIESQRRTHEAIDGLEASIDTLNEHTVGLRSAIDDFKAAATGQTTELIRLSTGAERQTRILIRLTEWIIALTVILGVIAALQLWAMLAKGA